MAKKPSLFLFRLIKSLDKSEKRYIKIQLQQRKGKTAQLLGWLFDEIDKQEAYDEKALKSLFQKEKKGQHFSNAKRDLYLLILKGLRCYKRSGSAIEGLRQQLRNAEILHEKGLDQQAIKQLDKARQSAVELEAFPLLLEILQKIRQINSGKLLEKIKPEELRSIHHDSQHTLSEMEKLLEYDRILERLYHFYGKSGLGQMNGMCSEIDRLIEYPLVNDIQHATSREALLYHNRIQTIYYILKHQLRKALLYCRKSQDILTADWQVTGVNPRRWVAASNDLTRLYLHQDMLEEARGQLQLTSRFLEENGLHQLVYYQVELQSLSFQAEIKSLLKDPYNFEGMESLSRSLLPFVKENEGQLVIIDLVHFYGVLARHFLYQQQFDKAGEMLEAIRFGRRMKNLPPHWKAAARLLWVIVQYEQDSEHGVFLESQLLQAERRISENGALAPLEKLLYSSLRKTIRSAEKAEANHFEELAAQLERTGQDVFLPPTLFVEDLIIWAESKSQGTRMLKILEEPQHLNKKISFRLFI